MAFAAPFLAEVVGKTFILALAPTGSQGKAASAAFYNSPKWKIRVVPVFLCQRLGNINVSTIENGLNLVELLLCCHWHMLTLYFLVIFFRNQLTGVKLIPKHSLDRLGLNLKFLTGSISYFYTLIIQHLGHFSQ
ncbi:MAG TPA: hypothetical protein PK263_01865 [bacterium]|nr:hypothetical protein [bacterium]